MLYRRVIASPAARWDHENPGLALTEGDRVVLVPTRAVGALGLAKGFTGEARFGVSQAPAVSDAGLGFEVRDDPSAPEQYVTLLRLA